MRIGFWIDPAKPTSSSQPPVPSNGIALKATTAICAVGSFRSSSLRASVPFMSGSCRSIRTTSGTCSLASVIASAPFAASIVRNPAAVKTSRASLRFFSLSSTIRTIGTGVSSRQTDPDVGVVVLSQYANPAYALALLESGSARRSYLLKERVQDHEQLVSALHAVAEGGSVIDPKVVDALVADNARGDESRLNQLTPRERDVLREMAMGKSNAAIGESLFLAERSVEKVIHSIFLKLGLTWETSVHKRVKAVILYLSESD